jgi:hypothetical protein
MKSKLYKKLLNVITDNFLIFIHVFVINKLNIDNTNYLKTSIFIHVFVINKQT